MTSYSSSHQASHLVDLSPEPVFEAFLGLVKGLAVLEGVKMRQHAHDAGEAVHLADVEELEGLHLKAKAGINEHQHLEKKDRLKPRNLRVV